MRTGKLPDSIPAEDPDSDGRSTDADLDLAVVNDSSEDQDDNRVETRMATNPEDASSPTTGKNPTFGISGDIDPNSLL